MPQVLFIDTVHPLLKETLSEAGFFCVEAYKKSKAEIAAEIDQYVGLVIRSRFRLDNDFLAKATQLRFIARAGSGLENIDVSFAERQGITCLNAPEGNRIAVAEHALGMLLGLFNNLNRTDYEVRHGQWNRESNRGIELEGKTVGIIGYGNNGSAFGERLQGFGVNILAYDKYIGGFSNECTLESLQEKADVISLHVPFTPETKHLINARFIQQCGKPFYLINTARGGCVDTSAVVNALHKKMILGACLDVLEYEKSSFEELFKAEMPADFKALIAHPNIILSPHIAGWTHASLRKIAEILSRKILELFK